MAVDPSGNTKVSCRFCMYLCRYRKGILSVIWLAVLVSLIVNISSSLLLSKKIDLTGTLLGTFLRDPWIVATLSLFLLFITVFFGWVCPLLEQRSKQYSEPHLVSPEKAMQNRERLLPLLQTIYTQQLLPLKRAARINLELKQRFNMTLQPQKLIWLTPDNVEHPIAPETPIADIYRQAGNGLLILGAAGAGKSTLLVDLAQELLQQAQENPKLPFPIVLNLSSWANTQYSLEQWLAEELLLQYQVPHRLTATWIHTDQLFPLFDGLDEVKDIARTACIDAINHYKQRHLLPLVVCCRSDVYPSQEHLLALQSAIEIQPLDPHEVTNYFSATPIGKSISTALRQNKVLQELLTTPLMVQIMLLAYQGKSPKDLLRRGSPEEQQHYLFESYTQHMLSYRAIQGKSMPAKTLPWLSWLAQRMAQHGQSDFYLERLDVSWLPIKHPLVYQLVTCSFVGLLVGLLIGLLDGLVFGISGGLLVGLVFGLLFGLFWAATNQNKLVETITWSWKYGQVLVSGLVFGLAAALSIGLLFGLRIGLLGGLDIGLLGGLLIGLVFGISGGQLDEHARAIPSKGIQRSGQNGLRVGLRGGLLIGLLSGLLSGLLYGLVDGLRIGLLAGLDIGLLGALIFGLLFGLRLGGVVYINHYILRFLLSRLGNLPWDYEQFLDEAAECILLQKVGGGYRFIHQEFLKYFALLNTPSPTHTAETSRRL
jgi:hypothetical protein